MRLSSGRDFFLLVADVGDHKSSSRSYVLQGELPLGIGHGSTARDSLDDHGSAVDRLLALGVSDDSAEALSLPQGCRRAHEETQEK